MTKSFPNKVQGALLAHASGDALGWPQERKKKSETTFPDCALSFRSWRKQSGSRYRNYSEKIEKGEYSDDTQLTLAVGRSLTKAGENWWEYFTRVELPLWLLYERGGGFSTKRAAEAWAKGSPPWETNDTQAAKYFQAGGNGVAMRILPHVFHGHIPYRSRHQNIIWDGISTHGHPRALLGATITARAASFLLSLESSLDYGELIDFLIDDAGNPDGWGAHPTGLPSTWHERLDKLVPEGAKAWEETVKECITLLRIAKEGINEGVLVNDEAVLEKIGCYKKTGGAGTVSAVASVYLTSRFAAQPRQGVMTAAYAYGIDTDTIAAMTGGLLGTLSGANWLPDEWLDDLQDCNYIAALAQNLSDNQPTDEAFYHSQCENVSTKKLQELRQAILSMQDNIRLTDSRIAKIVSFGSQAKNNAVLLTAKLQVSDGQTLFFKKLSKDDSDQLPERPAANITSATSRSLGVRISTNRLQEMRRFYSEALRLPIVRENKIFVSFGPISLVRQKESLSSIPPGSYACAIENTNARVLFEALKKAKVIINSNLEKVRGGAWRFECKDPDGNLVEVIGSPGLTDSTTLERGND